MFVFAGCIGKSQLRAENSQLTRKENKKVLKKADLAYQKELYSVAAGYYEKYLQSIPDTSNTLLAKLAECYWKARQIAKALSVYKRMFKAPGQGATQQQQLRISELYARSRNYKKASEWLNGIDGYQLRAAAFMDTLKLKSMKKDSLSWRLEFLNINTPFREFSPVIVDKNLLFCSNRPNYLFDKLRKNPLHNYDRLWKVSRLKIQTNPLKISDSIPEGEYNASEMGVGKVASLVKGLEKIQYNIGTVSVDKNNHYYFTANYPKIDKKGINRLHLIEGFYNNKGSMEMKPLPFGNPKLFSVMHPAINRDGTFLVLSSDKPNGKGNYDLYYTQRKNILQPWDSLKAFGSNINTVGNEVFPTLTSKGYLYYSSDALPGLGGLDIYRISLQDALDGKDNVKHLSYPVNSPGDDFGWTQDSTAMKGFFTSDRLNNEDNLYSFYYLNRQKMRQVSGSTLDIQTNNPISDATVFMWNKHTNKVDIAKTDQNGKYHFVVTSEDRIILKAVKKGMTNDCLQDESFNQLQQADTVSRNIQSLFLEKRIDNDNVQLDLSDAVQLTDTISRVMQNLMLKKHLLKINDSWKLNNIHYSFNKWDVRPDAEPILDSLINLLKIYPIRVELASHTDSRGTSEYNDWLSQKRAESVVNYLVKHGVNRNRLTATGYGKSALLNQCADGVPCSEKEHQVNRRTEVRVISNTDIQKYQIDDIDPNQFIAGEQIDKNVLPKNFFDNCDKSNSSEDTIPSLKNTSNPNENASVNSNAKYRFPIRFYQGEFNIESQYLYILNELARILFKNPTIVLQITAQDDTNNHSDILSRVRANLIREYLINKGVSADRCQIDESIKSKSEIPYGTAVIHEKNVNMDDLLLLSLIQSYKGDTKEMIIRNDNGNYCVQLGAFRAKARSQHLADKIQSIISVPVLIIEEDSLFKIRTPYSTNRIDAIEIAAIIQASGVLYSK